MFYYTFVCDERIWRFIVDCLHFKQHSIDYSKEDYGRSISVATNYYSYC